MGLSPSSVSTGVPATKQDVAAFIAPATAPTTAPATVLISALLPYSANSSVDFTLEAAETTLPA